MHKQSEQPACKKDMLYSSKFRKFQLIIIFAFDKKTEYLITSIKFSLPQS